MLYTGLSLCVPQSGFHLGGLEFCFTISTTLSTVKDASNQKNARSEFFIKKIVKSLFYDGLRPRN